MIKTEINPKVDQNMSPGHRPSVLIIGIDSQIGSALNDFLTQHGVDVFGTTRRMEKINPNTFYLDLERPDFTVFNNKFNTVVLCAATTSIYKCDEDPDKNRLINVTNTTKLIDKATENDTFIIYLSSNAVFGGEKQFCKNSDKTCPTTLYGKFKVEVEEYLTCNLPNKSCVLRLTKVITKNTPLTTRWQSEAESGSKIKTFTNRFISPVAINDVVATIYLLITEKQNGIYQLGGNEELSYTEYAKLFFKDSAAALKKIAEEVDLKNGRKNIYSSLMTHLPRSKKYPKLSYSFEGSDLIVASLLRNIHKGLYIDVGANHPEVQSNTNYFYQQGWNGLAIDANEEFAKLWSQIRPRDIFTTELVSNVRQEVEFAIYPDNTISSMDKLAIERYSSRYSKAEIIKTVKTTTTLFDLKNRYFRENEVHLLSVDIEGEDLNCLLGAKLADWKPGVIVIETKNLSLYDAFSNDIVNYLTEVGYRLIAKTPLDAFFIYPDKTYFDWIPKSII